jgi:hypothetical protein
VNEVGVQVWMLHPGFSQFAASSRSPMSNLRRSVGENVSLM